jgi:hypothetical protein
MARGFNNWIAYLLSELDNEGSPLSGRSPGTHSLLMPTYGSGGLKLVHHLRLASTVRDDGAFASYLLGIVGGKGTSSLTLDYICDGYVKTRKLPIPSIEQFLACSSTAEFVSLTNYEGRKRFLVFGSLRPFVVHVSLRRENTFSGVSGE